MRLRDSKTDFNDGRCCSKINYIGAGKGGKDKYETPCIFSEGADKWTEGGEAEDVGDEGREAETGQTLNYPYPYMKVNKEELKVEALKEKELENLKVGKTNMKLPLKIFFVKMQQEKVKAIVGE